MKREKIIIITSGVVCASLIAITLILNKRLEKERDKVLELEYDQTKTQIKIKNLEVEYQEEKERADYYYNEYRDYEKRLEDIYVNAFNDDDKSIKEFFTEQLWKRKESGQYIPFSSGFKND